MSEPSQIAVKAARRLGFPKDSPNYRTVIKVIQDVIDKAVAEKEVEIEDLKQQRNMAAIQERRKYLPELARLTEGLRRIRDENHEKRNDWWVIARDALDTAARPEPASSAGQ